MAVWPQRNLKARSRKDLSVCFCESSVPTCFCYHHSNTRETFHPSLPTGSGSTQEWDKVVFSFVNQSRCSRVQFRPDFQAEASITERPRAENVQLQRCGTPWKYRRTLKDPNAWSVLSGGSDSPIIPLPVPAVWTQVCRDSQMSPVMCPHLGAIKGE